MRKVFHADVSYWKQPLTFSPSLAVKKNPAVIQFHVADFWLYSTVSRTAQRLLLCLCPRCWLWTCQQCGSCPKCLKSFVLTVVSAAGRKYSVRDIICTCLQGYTNCRSYIPCWDEVVQRNTFPWQATTFLFVYRPDRGVCWSVLWCSSDSLLLPLYSFSIIIWQSFVPTFSGCLV